jgi:hypothetical protein
MLAHPAHHDCNSTLSPLPTPCHWRLVHLFGERPGCDVTAVSSARAQAECICILPPAQKHCLICLVILAEDVSPLLLPFRFTHDHASSTHIDAGNDPGSCIHTDPTNHRPPLLGQVRVAIGRHARSHSVSFLSLLAALSAAYHSSTPSPHLRTSPPPAPHDGRRLRDAKGCAPSHIYAFPPAVIRRNHSAVATHASLSLRPSVQLASLHFFVNRLLTALARARVLAYL